MKRHGDNAKRTWDELAPGYSAAIARADSLDRLLDFPCQLRLIGDVRGSRVLDLGCGNGYKALHFAEQGALEVVGLDISKSVIDALNARQTPDNTRWIRANIAELDDVPELTEGTFDLVTILCSSLGDDSARTMRSVRRLLTPTGLGHGASGATTPGHRPKAPSHVLGDGRHR